jgi:hypothetical protein
MDAPSLSFAPNDIAFELGRMFAAHREMNTQSRKSVGVFRTLEEVRWRKLLPFWSRRAEPLVTAPVR